MMNKPSRHRYPMMIIGQAIWQYHRFNQSYRDVREQLLYRGIDISHETIRNWCYKFVQKFKHKEKYTDDFRFNVFRFAHKVHAIASALKNTKTKYLIWLDADIKTYKKITIDFLDNNYNVAIITPDKDIVPGADTLNPAYIVFDNYEIILQWNRSLRFALAVCTLKNKFKDEL